MQRDPIPQAASAAIAVAMDNSDSTGSTLTTCPYCGVGCGVRASPMQDGTVAIAGDAGHAANAGKLCVKGAALGETVSLQGRLMYPGIRSDGGMRRAGWEQALTAVADGMRRIIDRHGPDAVALYVSGQLLTEDYYVANKLMKGYIGSANIDTNSRLCMSSAVAGHKRAFGEDLVPLCYEDLEQADLVILVGSNTAWCHPILFQRIVAAKQARPHMQLVVIDPRRTATCELADLHLPVKSGTDVWLFNGLLSDLARNGAANVEYVAAHTTGMAAAVAAAGIDGGNPAAVAHACQIAEADLLDFYRRYAGTAKVVTAFSQGVNQSSAGTDKVNSIINCHLLTGRIGRPGMGPFSITGQPNAMGGREVGGMANMLAAHMDLEQLVHRDAVQAFWQSPRMADRPGLKAVALFEAIDAGRVKAVWIMGTNPVVSMPDADQVRRALSRCELVVVSDIVERNDTTAHAHILLPALGWGEKDGTVTNSERRISRQRSFLPAPGEARPDWQALCQVAQRMGYKGFDFDSPRGIFDEHARLSAWRNTAQDIPRSFNLAGLTGLDNSAFDALQPIQWPVVCDDDGQPRGTARLFADNLFSHADRRARFIATPPRAPQHAADEEYPLILNTGRVRDQWHTMTRTGKSARLAGHTPEPFIDIHPQDALLYGVQAGSLARISTRWGAMVARVQHSGAVARGTLFVPIHWTAQTASDARVGALVNPVVDPVSGEPEFKHTPAAIVPFHVAWHGFILRRDKPQAAAVPQRGAPLRNAEAQPDPASALTYWTHVQGAGYTRTEFAGREAIDDYSTWAHRLLDVDINDTDGMAASDADWLDYTDRHSGVYRAVHLVDGEMESCLFMSAGTALPSRDWLAGLFAANALSDADRASLLRGAPAKPGIDAGATVCSCFGVGSNTICNAIREHGCDSVAQVTQLLKAGGNCGSCVPEIKKLLMETRATA